MLCEKLAENTPYQIEAREGTDFCLFNIALDLQSKVVSSPCLGSCIVFDLGQQININQRTISECRGSQIHEIGPRIQQFFQYRPIAERGCNSCNWRV